MDKVGAAWFIRRWLHWCEMENPLKWPSNDLEHILRMAAAMRGSVRLLEGEQIPGVDYREMKQLLKDWMNGMDDPGIWKKDGFPFVMKVFEALLSYTLEFIQKKRLMDR